MLLLKPSRMISLCTPPPAKITCFAHTGDRRHPAIIARAVAGVLHVAKQQQGVNNLRFSFWEGGSQGSLWLACGLLVAARTCCVAKRRLFVAGVSHAMSPCPGYQNEVTIFDFGFGGGELRGSPGACGMLVQAHSFPYAKR